MASSTTSPLKIDMALPRGTPAPTPRARPARASGVPGTRTPAARCPEPSAGPRPMSLTDVAALRDAFRALSRGDFETASQVLAPDVEWLSTVKVGRTAGPGGVQGDIA